MAIHNITITPVAGKDGSIRYDLQVTADALSCHSLYETLEAAMDSFAPPLTSRVRSHIVEAASVEGKPVTFCLEDCVEKE
jgi:hypothetical protein